MGSPENPNFFIDFSGIDDFAVDDGGLPGAAGSGIYWPTQAPLNASSNVSLDNNSCFQDLNGTRELGSRKRVRSESCSVSGPKACREKMRRDRLNDRFMELGSILEPGKPPKMDKAAILNDAIRMVTQLRDESQKLKESNNSLQEKIKEIKICSTTTDTSNSITIMKKARRPMTTIRHSFSYRHSRKVALHYPTTQIMPFLSQ